MYKPRTKRWFINRIGHRIYRDDIGCCDQCRDTAKNGLIIADMSHATYLHMIDWDFGAEGTFCNYRDKL